MFKNARKFLRLLVSSISKPIFKPDRERCDGMHEWTSIKELLEASDQGRLENLCKEEDIPPLVSLCHGSPICRVCGYIANHNVNLNIENLVANLRTLDI